jgi:4-hydroxy-3-methylbut-2-en-1-yl diphosphate reductase
MSTAGLTSTAVLCTPLRVEQLALRRAARHMRLVHTGMGPRRATTTAATLPSSSPVLVAGVAAAQTPHLHPGDVVVATEVRASALVSPSSTSALFPRPPTTLMSNSATGRLVGRVEIRSAPLLGGALRGLGLRVHLGVIRSVGRVARGPVGDGSIAVDMESAQLAVTDRPFAVVRTIVDTPDHPLWHMGTVWRGVAALRTLAACRPALEWWAAATGPREVRLLSAPHPDDIRRMDLVLAVGSASLVGLAQREGVPAYLVNEVSEIDLRWLAGTTRLGIIADSAAAHLVEQIVHCLGGLGPVTACEQDVTREVS